MKVCLVIIILIRMRFKNAKHFLSELFKCGQSRSYFGEKEYYLSVGLNSGLQAKDLQRKKLNLVVVLDISGSMTNRFGNARHVSDDDSLSKMELAKKSLIAMTRHLKDEDRFGVVLFNNSAQLAKPLSLVGETDMDAIRGHIAKIYANGGTNMEAGFQLGTELFGDMKNWNTSEYENRVIFFLPMRCLILARQVQVN